MGEVSSKIGNVQERKVGVESAHGFGDCLFNVPLLRELSKFHNTKIGVAVRPHCKDAYYNVPWISEIIEIPHMWHGTKKLQDLGYRRCFQITQNAKFFEFRESDPNHSLINTPLIVGKQLNLEEFDNRPQFFPTVDEIQKTTHMIQNKPTIAIESVYNSMQSWADDKAFQSIINKYSNSHRILWLSNSGSPKSDAVNNMLHFTRRECIMCLRACDIFFSVGSGFFCASLALPDEYQPKKIVCLWNDDLYKYEEPLNTYKWHNDITWVHNHEELSTCLKGM